ERAEYFVRGDGVFDAHLHQSASLRIHSRLPQLRGIHLAKTLVALYRLPLFGLIHQPLDCFGETGDVLSVLAALDISVRRQQILEARANQRDSLIFRRAEESR